MFGTLVDDEEVGWGRLANARFARRSFRDVDYTALVAAGITLTAGVVNAVSAATKPGAQSNYPSSYQQQQCPQGYVFNPNTRMCDPVGASGSFFSNIDPTMLLVGGGLLVLLLTSRS